MREPLSDRRLLVDTLIGDQAGDWDLAGRIPESVLRELGARGLLCAEVPKTFGGPGLSSRDSGEFTAYVGARCSSVRSVMTSQGMAAWMILRLGDPEQQREYLPQLTGGRLAAVGFSEEGAGSDLGAMASELQRKDGMVVLNGHKKWMTAADYADLLVVVSKDGDGAAAVVVPTTAPGVRVERVESPLGCRAAGHANVTFDDVRLPAGSVLGAGRQPLPLLITTALAYGRISVAWGCVGILRACLLAAARHARSREQFGKSLADHQLVSRHLAELFVAEQTAARACEHASDRWDSSSPDVAVATVLAKHVSASRAAQGAAAAVQVMASAGALDSHVVARAYRDTKLMEIIEGSSEICQLVLSRHVLATS